MSVRTTVTLDEDVYYRLKEESRKRAKPFRQTLNDIIREGLLAKPAPAKKFVFEAVDLGMYPHLNYDDIEGLITYGEGEDHR